MNEKNPIVPTLALLVCILISCDQVKAGVFQINSPADFINQGTTINFEGYSDLTIANNIYQNHGITFSRDDGFNVVINDVAALGWSTSSGNNALATIGTQQNNYSYITSLNVFSTTPLYELGAYFGNDQTIFGTTDFTTEQLSAYDSSGDLLGLVSVSANQNTFVDQFIGIGSDTAIASARFENLSSSGTPSQYFSVVLMILNLSRPRSQVPFF